MKKIEGGVCAPEGFKANGVHCGIRKNKTKRDLSLIVSDVRCAAACVYTQNLVKGAPIAVTKRHVADGYAQAIVCNSGNANTCNANGEEIAEGMCKLVSERTGIPAEDVVVASTGVIRSARFRSTRLRRVWTSLSKGWGTTACLPRRAS